MTTPNLAKIERVDLREAWPNEARDFTPWLARNITELGEALGMDLKLQEIEATVGDFSLDILATDLNDNRPVIIENQLESTNHDHFGKLLTYAAGYDANVLVWLTRDFRDEHRAALDWLNQRTGDETQFFGVVVELWKIGDSLPAPHFRLVASPNGWVSGQRNPAPASAQDEQNYEWRRNLIESFRKANVPLVGRRFQAKATWLVLEWPIPDVRYAAFWHRGNPGLEMIAEKRGIERREWNQSIFETLESDKSQIEASLADSGNGEHCVWQSAERRQGSRVAVFRDGNIFGQQESWEEYRNWMVAKHERFREVFRPYLEDIDAQEQTTLE